jgi:hypothetical protein
MKNLKNVILTEEDLRKIISKNILSEKRFYTYRGPAGGFRGDMADVCSVTSVVDGQLADQKNDLKASIIIGVGQDEATGDAIASKATVSDPIRKSESEAALGGEASPGDERRWKMTIGYEDKRGRKKVLALFMGIKSEGATYTSTEEDDEGIRTEDETPLGFTTEVTQRIVRLANSDGSPTSTEIEVNQNGRVVGEDTGEWYYNAIPEAFDWMGSWISNKLACPDSARDRITRGRRSRSSSRSGVYAVGALAKTSWWNGDRDSGEPVSSESSIDSGETKRVVVVINATTDIQQALVENISSLESWAIPVTSSGTYSYLINGGSMSYNRTFSTSAAAEYPDNKASVGNMSEAMRTFGNRHDNFKIFLRILAKASKDNGGNSSTVRIRM